MGIAMTKGALCRLTCTTIEPGHARMDWLVPAKFFRPLA
jgi:hypothetical protein